MRGCPEGKGEDEKKAMSGFNGFGDGVWRRGNGESRQGLKKRELKFCFLLYEARLTPLDSIDMH